MIQNLILTNNRVWRKCFFRRFLNEEIVESMNIRRKEKYIVVYFMSAITYFSFIASAYLNNVQCSLLQRVLSLYVLILIWLYVREYLINERRTRVYTIVGVFISISLYCLHLALGINPCFNSI